MHFLGPDVISFLRSSRLNNRLTLADVMQLLANHKWIALYQKYIFWMTIHVYLKHHLLYEFILLLYKWLQSFSHLSFEPAQKWNRIFSVHITPKNYSHCCWFQGPSVLPFTFFLCEDEFVSKFGFSLILPPEFVSILSVFWAEIQQSLNVMGHRHLSLIIKIKFDL